MSLKSSLQRVGPEARTTPSGATPFSRSREELSFLQGRVARFGLLGAGVTLFALVFRLIMIGLSDRSEAHLAWNLSFHALGGLCFFAVWLLCRGGPRGYPFVRSVECAGLLASAVAFMLMGRSLVIADRPDLVMPLVLSFGLLSRCLYVPSPGRLTLGLGVAIGALLLVGIWSRFRMADPAEIYAAHPAWQVDSPKEVALGATLYSAMWWTITVVISTGASVVIYGLRREVRNVRRLGQYTLEQKLGEGGMGQVFRARHAMLRRPTAIKLLAPGKMAEEEIRRFEREVQTTANLSHPNTITIFDYGRTPDGLFYYAMELIEGANLSEMVRADGPLPPERVVHILDQVASALGEAHGVGLIHRDLKPSNIMLCRRGGVLDVAKVLDFGLVKEVLGADAMDLTHVDAMLGTPHYMSPESIRDPQTVDPRSDVYALGAIAWFLLSGREVFSGNTILEVCSHHLQTPAPELSEVAPETPEPLAQLVMDCLAKQPEDRPASTTAFQERLSAATSAAPWNQERAREWWERHGGDLESRRATADTDAGASTFVLDLSQVYAESSATP